MNKFFSTNLVTATPGSTVVTNNNPSGLVVFNGLTVPSGGYVDFTITNSFLPSNTGGLKIYKPHLEMLYIPGDMEYLGYTITNWAGGNLTIRVWNPSTQPASNDITFAFNLDNYQI